MDIHTGKFRVKQRSRPRARIEPQIHRLGYRPESTVEQRSAVTRHGVSAARTTADGILRHNRSPANQQESDQSGLPILTTVDEAADLLRTTRRAVYAMIERRQLPGVIRIRRRVLLRTTDLLNWLDQKRAPSSEE
jgi:excisionase family DNA binding protein